MNQTLNITDKVILMKPMNEKLYTVGIAYEIGNITDKGFIIRKPNTGLALAFVSFEDFDKYFSVETKPRKWTDWGVLYGDDGLTIIGKYRTNRKKVQVRIGNFKGEACCNQKYDNFNLAVGLDIALKRCQFDLLTQKANEYYESLKILQNEFEQMGINY